MARASRKNRAIQVDRFAGRSLSPSGEGAVEVSQSVLPLIERSRYRSDHCIVFLALSSVPWLAAERICVLHRYYRCEAEIARYAL